jgi:transposase-like protein
VRPITEKEDYAVRDRVAPSAWLEAEIAELLLDVDNPERLGEIGRLGARLVLQRAIEEEVTEFLGRARYERTDEAQGSRNGNRARRVQTAEGELEVQVPQVRGAAERFVSGVIPNGRTALRTRPLETLIIGGWVRGLSDRDIESLIADAGLGQVSKSTVSEITHDLRDRYQAFRARSLAEVSLLVLFLDATYLPTRPSGPKEGVLVAWGYNEQGQRVLLDVVLGQRERYDDWLEMGRGLVQRGLRSPLLVVTDGAPGLVRAIEELWPDADRQRCTVHRVRNLLAKLPKKDEDLRQRVEAAYWAALDEATSATDGEARLRQLVSDLERQYPSAAACLAEDLPALCVHLAYPLRLRKRLRSTNLLERSLEEVKRRTKVIGRFPGETSCLSLCWAVLDLFIASARGLGLTPLEHRQLAQMWATRTAQTAEVLTA